MAYGFGTWDASGVDNNTGLVRILALGVISLARSQVSGSWSFSVPAGYTLDFLYQGTDPTGTTDRRMITISGNTVSISAANGNYAANTTPAESGNILVYVR